MTIDHIAALKPDKRNARQHNPRNIDMLTRSLQEVGAARSIVIDEDDNILAGNGTIEAAAQVDITRLKVVEADGNEIVAVRRRGLTPEQKQRLALYDNRTAELADWDTDVLAELRSEDALDGLFFDDELDALLASVDTVEPGDGGDDFDTTPADGPTRVQPGDLWRIGPHRMWCGDSTDVAGVERMLQGDRPVLMWTDPPYGVDYVGKTKAAMTLKNDKAGGLEDLLRGAFGVADIVLADGAAIYVAHPAGALSVVFDNCFVEQGWRLHQTLVWVKDSMVLGHSDYHFMHEPITFGYKPAEGRTGRGGRGWYGDNAQVSVFEVPRPKRSDEHPTAKPIELIAIGIRNSSPSGGIIYDPFAGRGSTLTAAHRLERVARLCDIDPRYCDVILRRAEAEGIGPIELVGNSGT